VIDLYRIGNGYDVHRLVKDRKLVLGGVDIPFELGLMGHSDADVLIHAIIDAILGAMGARDIGNLFPDTSAEYKDISSMKLLKSVSELMEKKCYAIVNIDSVVVAQAPKLSPYIEKIEKNISECLNIDNELVNVKAKTEEHLGFTGKQEGIKAYAVLLLQKKS
jgi:2-C-methyl-D-erythritol 2,4-cyclodiphosphate synthase